MKRALLIVTILVILVSALAASQAQAKPVKTFTVPGGTTTRVSVSSDGLQANFTVGSASISNSGRYVAFNTSASWLTPGHYGSYEDVFVHDMLTGQTTIESVYSYGIQGNGNSNGGISSDGRYVVFSSDANNLVSEDTNNATDVFIRDRITHQTTRVSLASDGTQGNAASYSGSISADGRYVAFSSYATNLVSEDTNDFCDTNHDDVYTDNCLDAFVRDLLTGVTTLVSVSSNGAQANGETSGMVSSDGRYVLFRSFANNLVSEDTNNFCDTNNDGVFTDNCPDIFVHDLTTGQTTLVSVASDGTQANGDSWYASFSANGRYIAFKSDATNLVSGDMNNFCDINDDDVYDENCADIFVHDLLTGQTSLASVASDGTQANWFSEQGVSISPDGRFVAFASRADNLVSGDINNIWDVFVHDLLTGQTILVSVATNGTQGNATSWYPAISTYGRYVAFQSDASNLVSGDTNGYTDIFVHWISDFYGLTVGPLNDGISGAPGETVNYTLTLTNTGNISDTFGVVVSGNTWPTTAPATIGPLDPSASQAVTIAVTVPSSATGSSTDTATVTLTSQGDNTQSGITTLSTTANNVYSLAVEPATDVKEGLPGDTVDYTLTVTNTGNTADTFDVVVSSNAWTTNAPATVGPLAAGAGQELNISVIIPSSVTGGGVDTATITLTSQGDKAITDSASLTTTAIAVDADLEVSVSTSTDPVIIGDDLTYTIVVTNHGPTDATNVVLTDNLPPDVSYISVDSGCSHVAGVVTCNLNGIANGSSKTVQIVVSITATGTLENTATVTSDQPDPNPGNNSDTTTTQAEFRKIYLPMINR
jgi:uncharacterized repeat protein (TIGR01451 family)